MESLPPSVRLIRIPGSNLVVISIPCEEDGLTELGLTAAERDIAARLLAGEPLSRIAQARGTSMRTVSKQVSAVYRKVGVGSRGELVAKLTRT